MMHISNKPSSNYLEYTIEQKESILKKYGKTVESFKEDVEAIKLWSEKQPHIPKNYDDEIIAHRLFANKFIFNDTKKAVDWFFRIRHIYPECWKSPDEKSMVAILNQCYILPLPKMTSSNCRVIIGKLRIKDLDPIIDPFSCAAHAINMADFMSIHDGVSPKIVVIDCKDGKLEHCALFTPSIMKVYLVIFKKCYKNSVQSVHLVNLPPLTEAFLTVVKSLLSRKMASRIHVHRNINSIFKLLDREIFPKDYGGDEMSLDELHELWKDELFKNIPWFKQRKELVTDESLRVEEAPDCDLLGFQGKFKQLSLD